MPFTLSHAAAALPFRRTRLITSALIVGCLAPDFEYFIPFFRHGKYGHTLLGIFTFDLPLSLAVLWLFFRLAREPLVACLPEGIRARINENQKPDIFTSLSRTALTLTSILVGIATHLLWDAFTHPDNPVTDKLSFLYRTVSIPAFGSRAWYAVLQYFSSAFGIAVILIWLVRWYRNAHPIHRTRERIVVDRIAMACLFVIASVSAFIRAAAPGIPHGVPGTQRFMTDIAITGLTVLWVGLLIYGVIRIISGKFKIA